MLPTRTIAKLPKNLKYRTVLVPGCASPLKVPRYVVRVDIGEPGQAGTHGWQVRYAKPSAFFSDGRTKRGLREPKTSLAEAKRYLAQLLNGPPTETPYLSPEQAPAPSTETGFQLVTKQQDQGKEIYVEVTPPGPGPVESFYVGTETTITRKRMIAALKKARATRKLMVAAHLHQTNADLHRLRRPGRPVVALDAESLRMRWLSRMAASWRVWLQYKDVDSGQVYFYDSQYGSSQKALKHAQAYRDAFVSKHGIPLRAYTGEGFYSRHSRNKGNLVGVNLSTNNPDNPEKATKLNWTSGVQQGGRQHRKSWSIQKYGYVGAWQKAVDYRCGHTGETPPKSPPKPPDWLKRWARLNKVKL